MFVTNIKTYIADIGISFHVQFTSLISLHPFRRVIYLNFVPLESFWDCDIESVVSCVEGEADEDGNVDEEDDGAASAAAAAAGLDEDSKGLYVLLTS